MAARQMSIDLSHKNLTEFDSSAFSTERDREILRSIAQLNLSHNSISSIEGLGWLSSLTTLDLSHNYIHSLSTGLPPLLRQLNVAFNILRGLEGIKALTKLEVLVASNNQLTGLLGLPPALRILDVSGNQIASLVGLETCGTLEELRVRRNMIESVEALGALSALNSLRTLTLAGNPVISTCQGLSAARALLTASVEATDLPSSVDAKPAVVIGAFDLQNATRDTAPHSPAQLTGAEVPSQAVSSSTNSLPQSSQSDVAVAVTLCDETPHALHQAHEGSGASVRKDGGGNVKAQEILFLDTVEDVEVMPVPSTYNGPPSCQTAYSSVNVSQETVDPQLSPWRSARDVEQGASKSCERARMDVNLQHLQAALNDCQEVCRSCEVEKEALRLRIEELEAITLQQTAINSMFAQRFEEIQDKLSALTEYTRSLTRSGYLDVVERGMCGKGDAPQPLSGGQEMGKSSGLPNAPNKRTAIRDGVVDSIAGQEHRNTEGAPSLETRAEIRREARSLAEFFMSIVPGAAGDQSLPGTEAQRSDNSVNVSGGSSRMGQSLSSAADASGASSASRPPRPVRTVSFNGVEQKPALPKRR
ncbi:hypothetical protein TRVL_06011 [Trypanosoma vivax]|nr:hypothetical protein TRVL_06011 [Trypanosoma vivax]